METNTEYTPSDDVQDLIWAMLDEQISEADFRRLEELLRSDPDARRLYIQCVQIHVDLQRWFGATEEAQPAPFALPVDMPLPNGGSAMTDSAFERPTLAPVVIHFVSDRGCPPKRLLLRNELSRVREFAKIRRFRHVFPPIRDLQDLPKSSVWNRFTAGGTISMKQFSRRLV